MRTRQKRWRVVAFVAVASVVAALPSFRSSAWATPAQHAQQQTVKRPDIDCCEPGQSFVFEITFIAEEVNWTGVKVYDTLHSFLKIEGVTTSHGTASYVGQDVTVNIPFIPLNDTVIIRITSTVRDGAPECFLIYNTARVTVEYPASEFNVPKPPDDPMYIEVCCPEFVPEPGSLLLLGGGLAGLAGYAGMRWSNRRRA